MHLRLLLAAAATAVPLSGQNDHKLQLPTSLALVEGDTSDSALFNTAPYVRWQQTETDSASWFHIIRKMRFRRDGNAPSTGATGRALDVELKIGVGDPSAFGTSFAGNYLMAPTVILPRTTVNLPDWSQRPPTVPAPFDLELLMSNLGIHPGGLSLVWEMQVWHAAPPQGTYVVDATAMPGSSRAWTVTLGQGCVTPNSGPGGFASTSGFITTQKGAASSLTLDARGGYSSMPIVFVVGSDSINASICQRVWVDPATAAAVPLGVADAAGDAKVTMSLGPYNAWWPGALILTQAVSIRPTNCVVSNGVQVILPAWPPDGAFLVSTSPGAPTGTLRKGGVVVEVDDLP